MFGRTAMMHCRATLLLCCTCLLAGSHSRTMHNVNEVLKGHVTDTPKTPLDTLEALYYEEYAGVGRPLTTAQLRSGRATTKHTCSYVRSVPQRLRRPSQMRPRGIDPVYQRYTEAYGIPVVGSAGVPDRALARACYVLRFLLADRADLRRRYRRRYGRVAVIAAGAALRSIPEYGHLPAAYDVATSGLGAVPAARVSTARQENVLCWGNDSSSAEDILLRELAHGIRQLAGQGALPALQAQLVRQHAVALASGWWTRSYARLSPDAYFGEGVQSYFNANAYANPANGYNNAINTRAKLRTYDPGLFLLVQKIFPCANNYIKRCNGRGNEDYQLLRMNCPLETW